MQSGGPFFPVELGRLDGLSSTASSVPGQLPEANQTMDQLLAVFKAHGLNMSDLVALSGPRSSSDTQHTHQLYALCTVYMRAYVRERP
jgi:hypothetical protein